MISSKFINTKEKYSMRTKNGKAANLFSKLKILEYEIPSYNHCLNISVFIKTIQCYTSTLIIMAFNCYPLAQPGDRQLILLPSWKF